MAASHQNDGINFADFYCRVCKVFEFAAGLFLSQLAANIGPELFYDDGHCVVANLAAPNAHGVAKGPVATGMVAISGNAGRSGTAEDFREVELLAPGIGAC